jgi:hypothetical protein
MDLIAICAIFKDEAPYIMEWLAFHKAIGVDIFVLYDNGSTDGGPELVRKSRFANNVVLIDWPYSAGQIPAYQHFCMNHAHYFGWVAIIDLDEFLMPIDGDSIRKLLADPRYADYSAILPQWLVFGPSGHQRRPEGLVIESYTLRLPEHFAASRHVKSLVRGRTVMSAGSTPHIVHVSGPTCNTRGETVYSHAEQPDSCHEVMAINHYFTKSREDWLAKVRRGKADAAGPTVNPYQGHVYGDVERDAVVPDTRAVRFASGVKALLNG